MNEAKGEAQISVLDTVTLSLRFLFWDTKTLRFRYPLWTQVKPRLSLRLPFCDRNEAEAVIFISRL